MNLVGKICLFADLNQSNFGGMENHATHFIRFFSERNDYQLVYIVTKNSDGLNTVVNPFGKCIFTGLKSSTLGFFLAQEFEQFHVICFFNNGWWIEDIPALRKYLSSAFFCQRTGGNEVLQAALIDMSLSYKNRIKFWVNTINTYLDAFITNSSFTTKRMASIGINRNIVFEISGGVDVNACQSAKKNKSRLRRLYFGEFHNEICVVSASRFVDFKGLDVAIAAVSIAQKMKSFVFFIVGSGEQEYFLKKTVEQDKNLRCVFLGAKSADESLKIITSADLLLCLSRECRRQVPSGYYIHTETMGRSALEGICAGIPVVASRVGGLPQFITDEYGYLTEPDSPKETACKIIMAINSQRKEITSLSHVWNLYSWDTVFSQYMSIWNNK